MAVAPRTAYPEEYAPLSVMTGVFGQKCAYVYMVQLTFGHIPTQVPETIQRVEGERRCQDRLAGVFYDVRHASHKLDHVRGRKGLRGNEVCNEVGVHHCGKTGLIRHYREKERHLRLTSTKSGARDTVCDGSEPCQLRLVDGEVGAARTLQALLVEYLLCSRRWQRLCLNVPVG